MRVLHKFTNPHYYPPNTHSTSNHLNGSPLNNSSYHPYTIVDGEFLYLDLNDIKLVSKTINGHTDLHVDGIGRVQVREHISEVVALMEGRDPNPAKILFNNK